MGFEKSNDNNPDNELELPHIGAAETDEEQKASKNKVESYRNEFLKKHDIELLSDEEKAKMSYGEVLSYQVKMKDKIFNVQNNLPPKDFDASRVIFDEALSKLEHPDNIADYYRLKKQFGLAEQPHN